MIISKKHKFIFLKSSRVSGTTMQFGLSTQCHEEDLISFNSNFNKIKVKVKKKFNIKNPNFFVTNIFFFPRFILKSNSSFLLKKLSSFYLKYLKSEHIEANKVKKLLNKSDFKKYFKFTIVRNPYDQFESYFYHSKSIDFKNFCKRNAVKFFSKEKKIISINNKLVVDKVLKYEDGFKNIMFLKKKFNFDNNFSNYYKNNKINFINKRFKKNLYDDETKNIIFNSAKFFFHKFKYKK